MTLIDKVRDLIAKDKTDYVFRELLDIKLDQDTVNTILLLSAQWNGAKKDYNIGITSSREWLQAKARINHSLLQILSELSSNINFSDIENRIEKIEKMNTINLNDGGNIIIQDVNSSHISINTTKNEPTEKLKLLIINSLPVEKQPLSVNKEIKLLEDAYFTSTKKDRFELITKNAVKFDELFKIIHQTKPTYIHFSLHSSKSQGLIFENQSGTSQYIDKNTFAEIFALTAKNNNLKLVVLNACNSYDFANEITKYVDYSVGMKDFIPDAAAVAFAKGFYEMLFEGEDIDYAFNAGIIALKMSRIEFNSSIPIAEIPVLLNKKSI